MLAFSLFAQSLGVIVASSLALPETSRWRIVPREWFWGGSYFLAPFGLFIGALFAVGALHYGNCERFDFYGGTDCTAGSR